MNDFFLRSFRFQCAAVVVIVSLLLAGNYLGGFFHLQSAFATTDPASANPATSPQLVAAGTAEFIRPRLQDNKKSVRVKLAADVAAHLGSDYIVLLTNRFPIGGFPYFSAYWKPAADGFDISLIDISISDGTTASYDNPNTKYLIDWLVVRK